MGQSGSEWVNIWVTMGQNGSKWVKISRNMVKIGPFWGLRQGGTGQEWPKGGQRAIEMCFGNVLDHLDAILVHFEPKLKIEIFSILTPFWAILGPFFGPLNSAKSFWGPPPLPQYKKKQKKKTSYFERSRECFLKNGERFKLKKKSRF